MNTMPAANMTDAEAIDFLLGRRLSLLAMLRDMTELLRTQYDVHVSDQPDGTYWLRADKNWEFKAKERG
jgi:hypothetical protein